MGTLTTLVGLAALGAGGYYLLRGAAPLSHGIAPLVDSAAPGAWVRPTVVSAAPGAWVPAVPSLPAGGGTPPGPLPSVVIPSAPLVSPWVAPVALWAGSTAAPRETASVGAGLAPVVVAPAIVAGLVAAGGGVGEGDPTSPRPLPSDAEGGFALSSEAQAKLGLSATKELTKWFQASLLDAPTMGLSPETAAAWQAYKVGEHADYALWVSEQRPGAALWESSGTVAEHAEAVGALETGEGLTGDALTAVTDGLVDLPPLEFGASSLSPLLQGLAWAGALMDIGFTITGRLPDAQKAIIAAMDVATIALLYVPVYGWIAAAVLAVVRMFLGSMFGSSLTHAQREALEVARTARNGLNPWMRDVADALSPRELVARLIQWGTGSCGGTSEVALLVMLTSPTGERVYVAAPGCYLNAGHAYHEWPRADAMDRDALALALVRYGATETGLLVQAGVAQHFLDELNGMGLRVLRTRLAAWGELLAYGFTLDDLDTLAHEQRETPRWNRTARFFGATDWHSLVGDHLQDRWTRYVVTSHTGTLGHFASLAGYPSWLAMRDAVLAPYVDVAESVLTLDAELGQYDGQTVLTDAAPEGATVEEALTARLARLAQRMADLAGRCTLAQLAASVPPTPDGGGS